MSAPPDKPRLLIVDDLPANIEALAGIFTDDCEISVATCGADAVEIARAGHFDLILLDIMMPGMTGHEVCKILKGDPVTRKIPIIFITSLEEKEEEAMGLALGAVDYIVKPIRPAIVKARVHNHLELVLAREAADEANRAKSAFLAMMSHEIRTPLNGILGFAEILANAPLPEKFQHFAQTILNSGQGLLTVINDILDFSKIEAGHLELEEIPFALDGLLGDIEHLYGPGCAAKEVTLRLERDPGLPPTLAGDPGRLRQILCNLVSNAVKFTNRGGEIVLSVTRRDEAQEGIGVRFCVADTGIGIAPEAWGRLFQPFAQATPATARQYGGTGLGLAISARLVRLMGGEMQLESQPGQGSRFGFSIAMRDATRPEPRVAPEATLPGTLQILICEDDPVNRLFIAEALESLAITGFVFAVTGREGVEQFPTRPWDLILMDCHMPEMDGMTATRRIRQLEAGRDPVHATPIIALTADVLSENRTACLEAGMSDFLAKPFTLDALQQCLHNWLNPATEHDQQSP
ncbi:MAG: response regulator [Magnetococcales bacterium]|nr:response regulator [Magnetococcales bacterium]